MAQQMLNLLGSQKSLTDEHLLLACASIETSIVGLAAEQAVNLLSTVIHDFADKATETGRERLLETTLTALKKSMVSRS